HAYSIKNKEISIKEMFQNSFSNLPLLQITVTGVNHVCLHAYSGAYPFTHLDSYVSYVLKNHFITAHIWQERLNMSLIKQLIRNP
ncbi:hypothetical protein EVA_22189, partial [gut metagenome]